MTSQLPKHLPSSCAKMTIDWPPAYAPIFAKRQARAIKFKKRPELLRQAKAYYKTRPVEFINDWATTYDPRNAGGPKPTTMPFAMFPKQEELTRFLHAVVLGEENGLIEKARDMGATWVCCAFSVWLWLFWPGSAVGWGSRKEQLVDKLGDPDSIFEKIRILIRQLPRVFWPDGFDEKQMAFMKIINPENGASITGEAGDNIGRGGRKLIYFKDESAHYERPEKIEAALGDTTRTQIDISSVNGLGNVFHRKREAGAEWLGGEAIEGKTNVFVMDWSDHPHKTQRWYDTRKAKWKADGLAHIFAQEVDRDYGAAVAGIIIKPEWVKAAIDAHILIDWFDDSGQWSSALDVADSDDGAGDSNAQSLRKGVVLRELHEWAARDTGVTSRNAAGNVEGKGEIDVQYDSIGMGSSVKAEVNNLIDTGVMPRNVRFVPWNAAADPQDKEKRMIEGDNDSPIIGDFFQNLKAQGWWELARRFEKTYKARTEGRVYPSHELISLDSRLPLLRKLQKELSQPTSCKSQSMKWMVDKKPEGTSSPNLADSVMMDYWPMKGLNYNLSNL